jgi:uncharacterized protein (DUF2267 family)
MFAFVVLRDLLGTERTARLGAEVDAALRDAYAASYDKAGARRDQRSLPADGLPAHPDERLAGLRRP